MDRYITTSIGGCGFCSGATCKLNAFTKQSMGRAPRTYACIQSSEVKMLFTAKACSREDAMQTKSQIHQ